MYTPYTYVYPLVYTKKMLSTPFLHNSNVSRPLRNFSVVGAFNLVFSRWRFFNVCFPDSEDTFSSSGFLLVRNLVSYLRRYKWMWTKVSMRPWICDKCMSCISWRFLPSRPFTRPLHRWNMLVFCGILKLGQTRYFCQVDSGQEKNEYAGRQSRRIVHYTLAYHIARGARAHLSHSKKRESALAYKSLVALVFTNIVQ